MKRILAVFAAVLVFVGAFFFYLNHSYVTPILMYHSFDENRLGSYASVSPDVFYQQMKFIKDKKYKVIELGDYCRLLKTGEKIPKKAVVITIDDGHADNLEAIKILKEFDYPAIIFVIPRRIGSQGYMSRKDILAFLKDTNINIGSHTLNHPYLPETEDEEIKKQILASKEELENLFSRDIETIAYPIGGFNEQSLGYVREAGYLCACTTNRGFSKSTNRFALRRIKVTNRDKGLKFWTKLSGFYNIFRKPKNPY